MSEFRVYGDNFLIEDTREWGMYKHVIGSIDKFKDERHLEKLLRADDWDLVIFDEAHRLSRRQYGLQFDVSHRFQLANILRAKTRDMLLLSATPHQGKADKFQSLLMLLNPEKKDEIQTLSLNPEILSEMMIRNNKSDVTDIDGNFIFKGKTTRAIRVPHDDSMKAFDESLQSYLKMGYLTANEMGQTGYAIGFVMTVYRKLAASSANAINRALKNRKLRLIEASRPFDEDSELFEDERYFGEVEENTVLSLKNKEFFAGELEQLDVLIAESEEVLQFDPKLKEFTDTLIPSILASNNTEKVLIFTEYRSTQEYLKNALEQSLGMGCVDLINGSMKHNDRRSAIERFEGEGQFLISTEAGGEGINLQEKCHIMINYDLPWNPMRLVQRIGRLYRYGQKHRVVVFNLYSPESMDDKIMGLMQERIEQVVDDLSTLSGEYNERLGEDIMGEIADLVDVESILLDAIGDGITRTHDRINEALNKAKSSVFKQRELFEYAAGYDPNEMKEELNITSEHVKSFTLGMFEYFGVAIIDTTHKDLVWNIKLSEELAAELGVRKTRWEITFDRAIYARRGNCEMIDLDNFIFKYLLKEAKSYEFGGLTAALKGIEDFDGAIVCSYLKWQNTVGSRQRQELVAMHLNANKDVEINPQAFCDWLKAPANYSAPQVVDVNVKMIYEKLEKVTSGILGKKSKRLLRPDGVQDLTAAILF